MKDPAQIQRELDAFDAHAMSFGPLPRYNSDGTVMAVGEPYPGSRVYVVWSGRATGLFYGWDNCHAMTWRFPGNAFVGCDSLEDAQEAFVRGPPKLTEVWRVPAPRFAQLSPRIYDGPVDQPTSAQRHDHPIEGGRGPDISNIVTQDNHPPPIDIPVEHDLTTDALQRWNTQADHSHYKHHPPSMDAVSGITYDTVSSGTIRTPGGWARNTAGTAATEEGIVAWAVIRGVRPGVYHSRAEADAAGGGAFGRKIVGFDRKTHAYVYFVQKYMKGMIGVGRAIQTD
uniref:Two-component response regulator SSK1p n=1 Tax=Ganoderma boninense TaxID=34458 RepID=A0A5K1K7E9_9APHY|nr:Putative two-component response regulator SSK1p [Ganoderma boninense]